MVVVVDEAGMVGTDDLRQLLTATTAAGVKTVLVGDRPPTVPREGPRRHVRPTLLRSAVDAEAVGGVADARPAGARRLAGVARWWNGPGAPRGGLVSQL